MKFGIITAERLSLAINAGSLTDMAPVSMGIGYIQSSGKIGTFDRGSLVVGASNGSGSYLYTNGRGSLVVGYTYGGGYISSQARGTFSGGYSSGSGSSIYPGGKGSIAFGHAINGYTIKTKGSRYGCLAFGYAKTGNIYAGAYGAIQFGQGSNTQDYSAGFGADIRLNFAGAPGTPRNGDQWVANNYVYIRSNGVSVKIT